MPFGGFTPMVLNSCGWRSGSSTSSLICAICFRTPPTSSYLRRPGSIQSPYSHIPVTLCPTGVHLMWQLLLVESWKPTADLAGRVAIMPSRHAGEYPDMLSWQSAKMTDKRVHVTPNVVPNQQAALTRLHRACSPRPRA